MFYEPMAIANDCLTDVGPSISPNISYFNGIVNSYHNKKCEKKIMNCSIASVVNVFRIKILLTASA